MYTINKKRMGGKGIFIPEKILNLDDISITSKVVLSQIYCYTKSPLKKCSLKNNSFEKLIGVKERQIRRIIKELKEKKYIKILMENEKRVLLSNEHIINKNRR